MSPLIDSTYDRGFALLRSISRVLRTPLVFVSSLIVFFQFSPVNADINDLAFGYPIKAETGQTVRLDPSDGFVYFPDSRVEYVWALIERPVGSIAEIQNNTLLRPDLTIDVAGDYVAELSVFSELTGQNGANSGGDLLDIIQIKISTENVHPVADIVASGPVIIGQAFDLYGSGSSDLDGEEIAYSWELLAKPAGSIAQVSSANGPVASITPDIEGEYTVELIVTDAAGLASPSKLISFNTASGIGPVAVSSVSGASVAPNESLIFDSFSSTNPQGLTLSSNWEILSGPANHATILDGRSDGRVGFSAPLSGDYLVALQVEEEWLDVGNGNNANLRTAMDVSIVNVGYTGNIRPVAVAGRDILTETGNLITLDATQSHDSNGDFLSFYWALIHKPDGSVAELDDATFVRPTFTPDVEGDYIVQLVVGDEDDTSYPATVLVSTTRVRPIANAGNDVSLDGLTSVSLDGSASTGSGAAALSFDWMEIGLVGQATGISALFDDAAVSNPVISLGTLMAPFSEVVYSELVYQKRAGDQSVGDGNGTDNPQCTFTTSLSDFDPASLDSTTGPDTGPELSAEGLAEGPNGVLRHVWQVQNLSQGFNAFELSAGGEVASFSIPSGASAFISLPDIGAETAILSLDQVEVDSEKSTKRPFNRVNPLCAGPTSTVVQLVVEDEFGTSVPDTVYVGTGNIRPVGETSPDVETFIGTTVNLAGSTYGSDIDGGALVYEWALISRPAGSGALLNGSVTGLFDGADVTLVADRLGIYLVQVSVSDGDLTSEPVVLLIEAVNRPPVAVAGIDADVFVGDLVTLNGTGSYDPDGDAISYNWSFVSRPSESQVTLSDASISQPTFSPDRRGEYILELVVSDYLESSVADQVIITAPNRAPVALIDAEIEIEVGATIAFFGGNSSDPDNDPLSYSWSLTQAPAGSSAVIESISDVEILFTPDYAGTYAVTLTVSDGLLSTDVEFLFDALIGNNPPVLEALQPSYSVEVGAHLSIDLQASDADAEDTLGFYANPLPLLNGMVIDATSGVLDFFPETGQEGSYTFTFGVSDEILTDFAEVTINVLPADSSDTTVAGHVYDAVDYEDGILTPLVGIPVSLEKAALVTQTDANGAFIFAGLTGGSEQVIVEPSEAGGPGGFTSISRLISVTENQEKILETPFLLGRIDGGCVVVASGVETVLSSASYGVTVTIPADTITTSVGDPYTGEVCLGSLPQGFNPEAMPDHTNACQIYALDAPGAVFIAGISVTAPNVDNLPAGAVLETWQLFDTLGRFLPASSAVVSVAGDKVVSDQSFLRGSDRLFAFLPSRPSLSRSDDQPTGNQSLSVFEGDVAQRYEVLGYRSFDSDQGVNLAYHSSAADPNLVVASDVTVAATAGLPVTLDSVVNLGGLNIVDTATWSARTGVDGSTPALLGEALTIRQSTPVDATGLPSGRYGYEFIARAQYDCSTVAASIDGEIYVHNESEGAIGTGWNVEGLQRLVENSDGKIAIVSDNDVAVFDPEPSFAGFSKTLSFPIDGGSPGIEVGDFDNNGHPDIIFAETGNGSVNVIWNFGDEELVKGDPFAVGPSVVVNDPGSWTPVVTGLDAGDLNKDGKPDFAFGTQFGERAGVLYGGQYNNFLLENFRRSRYDSLLPYSRNQRVLGTEISDYDGDGNVDVAHYVSNSFLGSYAAEVLVLTYGNANGNWTYGTEYDGGYISRPDLLQMLSFDVDADGNVDLITRSRAGIGVFWNNGNRTFLKETVIAGGEAFFYLNKTLEVSDLNGNGFGDIVRRVAGGLRVFQNTGGRSFGDDFLLALPPEETSPGGISLIDVENDGDVDVIYSGNGVYLFRNDGNGSFAPAENSPISHSMLWSTVADINLDGSQDVVAVNKFSVDISFADATASTNLLAGNGEFSTLTELAGGGWVRTYKGGTSVEFDAAGLQTATVDTQGNRTTYTYDAEGRPLTITDQVGLVTAFAYDASGFLESITDPEGNVTLITHSAAGNIVDITEPVGGSIQYAYDENNRLISMSDQLNNATSYSYDGEGRLSGANFPDGSSILAQVGSTLGLVDGLGGIPAEPFAYILPEDRVTTITDRKGLETILTVNEFGSPIEIIDPLGRITVMERDELNMIIRLERPSDADPSEVRVDEMEYDFNGNLALLREGVGTPLVRTTQYAYEPDFNKLVSQTDPGGFVTTYTYDTNGEVLSVTDPEGGIRAFTYTPEGKLNSRTDENLNTTSFGYNADLNLASITYADGSITEIGYDGRGNTAWVTEASGTPIERQVHRTYDLDNQLLTVEVTAADGISVNGQTIFTYDLNGNLATSTDETGLLTSYGYDALDRLITIDDPADGLIERTYNLAGEITQYIDGEGDTHSYTYDDVGRLISSVDPEANVANYSYDLSDNIQTVTDGRGNPTSFGYDVLERTITRTNPLGQVISRSYDTRDNLITLTREDTLAETATYDGNNRRLSVATPDNTLTYAYDANGNMTAANDNDSAVSFAYDARNRLASTSTDGTVGPQPASTLTFAYDALDRRISLSDHLGGTTAYAYDLEDRLLDLTSPWGTVHTMEYDAVGRRTSLTAGNGRSSTMAYTNGLLSALTHAQNGVALSDLAYDYAVDGQLIGIRDLLDPAASIEIDYDNLNRLVMVSEGVPTIDGGVPIPVEDFAYDGEGNRISSHLSSLYLSDDHNRLTEDSGYTYSYDDRGNRVSRTAKAGGVVESYGYDSQNRLVSYDSGTGTLASYAYDALERRIAKTVDGVTTAYVYDPWNTYSSVANDILLEFENGTLTRRWQHGAQVDEPLAFEGYAGTTAAGSGTEFALFADRQGSILAVVDPITGTVAAEYDYDAFGQVIQNGSLQQPFGFTGREFDAESGLYYYRARYYDPALGQFIQSDPIGFAAGDLNIYAYVENDPFNWTDPSGLTAAVDYTMLAGATAGATAVCIATECANGPVGIIGNGILTLAQSISDTLSNVVEARGGGKDGRKRPKGVDKLKGELAEAEAALAGARARPNKTPEDKAEIERLRRQIRRLRERLRASEPHAINPVRR